MSRWTNRPTTRSSSAFMQSRTIRSLYATSESTRFDGPHNNFKVMQQSAFFAFPLAERDMFLCCHFVESAGTELALYCIWGRLFEGLLLLLSQWNTFVLFHVCSEGKALLLPFLFCIGLWDLFGNWEVRYLLGLLDLSLFSCNKLLSFFLEYLLANLGVLFQCLAIKGTATTFGAFEQLRLAIWFGFWKLSGFRVRSCRFV